jgi:hypothetical protein
VPNGAPPTICSLWGIRGHDAERKRTREMQVPLAHPMPREGVVLATLADRLNNQAIAERLFISLDTATTPGRMPSACPPSAMSNRGYHHLRRPA